MNPAPRVSPRTELRLVAGFALLPPAAGLLMFVTCLAMWSTGTWALEGSPGLDAALSLGLAIAVIALIVSAFGAVPAVVALIRRGPISFRTLVLVAIALGNVPFAIIVGAIVVTQLARGTLSPDVAILWLGWSGTIRAICLGTWLGAACAAVLWFVGIRGTELERR